MFEKYLTKPGRLSCKQPQDIKNQWYIQKFQEVHGSAYDYSKVDYKTAKEKVVIICKQHGSFLQSPDNHIKGQGCPVCQGNKKKTTQQCIEDFKKVHENSYDYSMVQYANCGTKVEIICKTHGSFFQTPSHHLEGKGCPKCSSTWKKDVGQCIEDFKKVHGDTYDYSQVKYSGQVNKVDIICKEHGVFTQTPNHHLKGVGCPKCQVSNQNTLYLLKCLDTGLIKIGITNNIDRRISSIGGNLGYLHHVTLGNPRQLEKQLHQKYQQYQVFNPTVRNGGTEFFGLTDQQVSWLIESLKIVD